MCVCVCVRVRALHGGRSIVYMKIPVFSIQMHGSALLLAWCLLCNSYIIIVFICNGLSILISSEFDISLL